MLQKLVADVIWLRGQYFKIKFQKMTTELNRCKWGSNKITVQMISSFTCLDSTDQQKSYTSKQVKLAISRTVIQFPLKSMSGL